MTKSKEDAVSPVIGVILMVAVTVILAAVIAAFVFGMGSGVQKTKVVAVTAAQEGTNVVLTFQGGQDANKVEGLNYTFTPSTGTAIGTTQWGTHPPGVGNTTSITGATSGQDKVVATAFFSDGTTQVVLDTFV